MKLGDDVIVFDQMLHEAGRRIEAAIDMLGEQLEPGLDRRALEIRQRVSNNPPARITDIVDRRRRLFLRVTHRPQQQRYRLAGAQRTLDIVDLIIGGDELRHLGAGNEIKFSRHISP